jgi:hypothetical protein
MISQDEDALICDFAEYYHIYDYRALPVKTAATLACGLRQDSRISAAMQGSRYGFDIAFKAMALDYLALLWWSKTKDAENGTGHPASIYKKLFTEEPDSEIMAFTTGESFMEAWEKIARGTENG